MADAAEVHFAVAVVQIPSELEQEEDGTPQKKPLPISMTRTDLSC